MYAIRRFFVNVLCAFIINKPLRKKVRVLLNSNVVGYIRFIKRDLHQKKLKQIKTFIGYGARSLIISVDKQFVYKFPLRRDDANELARREKRIVDVFSCISPIYIPDVELLAMGKNIVRKYKYIDGVTLSQVSGEDVLPHIKNIAPQIARFIYDIGMCDPIKLRDLKPNKNAKPAYRFGWCHGDIADNFIIDRNTFKVIAFIDWEDAAFGDFTNVFTKDKRSPRRELMTAVSREYDKLYKANKNIKKSR